MSQTAALSAVLHKLSGRDLAFATDLIRAHRQYGRLTPAQLPWVDTLIARASGNATGNNAQVQPSVTVGSFANVIALFARAASHLKYPKVRLMLGSTPIVLAVAGERSSAPGTISIMGEGKYPNRAWFGRVTPAGEYQPARNVSIETQSALAPLFSAFGNDPHGTAAVYGKLTNSCCFCQRELTDMRSVLAGYGPTCADHYGLKAQWEAASKVTIAEYREPQPAAAMLDSQPSLFM